ncbi:UNVERIFIED_CONTAM: hypothetical protein Cloal_0161 [Acetivibrio alkalicellulosi]
MKKVIITAALIAIIISGCNIANDVGERIKSPSYPENSTDQGNMVANQEGEISSEQTEALYDDFIMLAINGKKPFELIAFMDREISKISRENVDNIILAFEEVLKMYESYYQNEFFTSGLSVQISNDFNDSANAIETIKDDKLKSLAKEVINGGYKLVSREGSVYPIVDYSFLKKYNSFMSDKVATYINIKANESDNPVALDAALVISREELEKRLLELEDFIANNSDFVRIDQLESIYYNYMAIYLFGVDNTPVYNYQTGIYKDDVIKSFNDMIKNHSGTKTADITNEYLNIIKENNYTINQKTSDFRTNLYKNANNNKMNYIYTKGMFKMLLPEKAGYKWIYNGFAEYGHDMELKEITESEDLIYYIIKGKVHDMSDGESGKPEDYYDINMMYTIEDGAIIQTNTGKMMMDSKVDSLELIRAPFIKGKSWNQIVQDELGNVRFLISTITDINEVGGAKVYTVEYRDQDTGYYEIRMIEEGVGVVAFTKLFQTDDGDFEIGYSLFREKSGY